MEIEIIKCVFPVNESPACTPCCNEIRSSPSKRYSGSISFYQHGLFINHITNKTYSSFQQIIRETKEKSNGFFTLSKGSFHTFVQLFSFFNHRVSSADFFTYKCKLKSQEEALPYDTNSSFTGGLRRGLIL